MTLPNRFRQALAEKLGTARSQADIARACGVSRAAVAQWFTGESIPKMQNLAISARVMGVRAEWLATGRGPMYDAVAPNDVRKYQEKTHKTVGIVGDTETGPSARWLELEVLDGCQEFFELLTPDPRAYGLIIKGDVMAPRFREGEAICLAPSIEAHPGDAVVVKKHDGTVMLRELSAQHGVRVALSAINPKYERITLDSHEIEWMHTVYAGLPMSAIREFPK